jgi:hypothetical protein
MTCSIEIDQSSAVAYQTVAGIPPDRIEISGSAVSCSRIRIVLIREGVVAGPVLADVDEDGAWTAVFQAPHDFPLGAFPCNGRDIKIQAFCDDEDSACAATPSLEILLCEGSGNCPTEASLEVIGAGGTAADASQCLPPGAYTVRVNTPVGSNIYYQWSINNILQSGASGVGQDSIGVNLAAGPLVTVSVLMVLQDIPNCYVQGTAVLIPCAAPPPTGNCLEGVSLAIENDPRPPGAPQDEACLEPGTYTFAASASPALGGVSYAWTVDGTVQAGASGSTFSFQVAAGETHTINVTAYQPTQIDECAPAATAITVTGCEQCADELVLQVLDADREPAPVGRDCLAAGEYTVRVVSPAGIGVSYRWIVDGQEQSGAVARSLGVVLNAGETRVVAVEVREPGCRAIRNSVTLRACACPDQDLAIVVTRGGLPVSTSNCVSGGNFQVRAVGSGLDQDSLEWQRDGVFLGNGDQAGFNFDPALVGNDCGSAPSTTVSVRASSRDPNCPPRTAQVTLTACRRFVLEKCIPCWLLKLGVLLAAGIFAVAVAIMMCPAVVAVPGLPMPAQAASVWAAVAGVVISAAPYVALAAAFILVILLGLWIHICKPEWCSDWLVLLWQLAISLGVIFIYFGVCPACLFLLLIGIPLFILGIILFIAWILSCRPSMCKVFFEIGNLALVQVVVGWLQVILGACVWLYGPIFMALWQTFLVGVGWIGFVVACLAAPPNQE